MQIFLRKYVILLALILPISSISQEDKIIEIKQSGGSRQDQDKFPGANILFKTANQKVILFHNGCLLYTSPSPRDLSTSRMPSSA